MFEDMGQPLPAASRAAFAQWLHRALAEDLYRAWLVASADGAIVAGAGLMVLPWPPGVLDDRDRIAFVYNVFTEPDHRRRGLARRLMETIHAWCREQDIASVRLHASAGGRPLYEGFGYVPTNEMTLRLGREGPDGPEGQDG
jgi:GNAT superfamily N-acetyltransferase